MSFVRWVYTRISQTHPWRKAFYSKIQDMFDRHQKDWNNVVMKTIYRSTKIVKISKWASSVVMLILTNYRVIKSVTLWWWSQIEDAWSWRNLAINQAPLPALPDVHYSLIKPCWMKRNFFFISIFIVGKCYMVNWMRFKDWFHASGIYRYGAPGSLMKHAPNK